MRKRLRDYGIMVMFEKMEITTCRVYTIFGKSLLIVVTEKVLGRHKKY